MSDEPESSPPRDPWAPPADPPTGSERPKAEAQAGPPGPPAEFTKPAPSATAPADLSPASADPSPSGTSVPPPPPFPGAPDPATTGHGMYPPPPNQPYPPYPPYAGPGGPGYPGGPGGPGYPGGYPGVPGYPAGPYGGWPPPAPRNGFGLTAMVLAIVGTVLGVACFGAFLGLPLGIAAIILGVIGVRIAGRGEATNRAQAMTGIILGSVSVVVSAAMIVLVVAGFSGGWFNDNLITADRGAYGSPVAEGTTTTYDDGVKVTVSDARSVDTPARYAADGSAVRFTVTVENTGDGAASLSVAEISGYEDEADDSTLPDLPVGGPLPDSLEHGAAASTDVVVIVPKNTDGTITIEVAPGVDYDYSYWDVDVPGARSSTSGSA